LRLADVGLLLLFLAVILGMTVCGKKEQAATASPAPAAAPAVAAPTPPPAAPVAQAPAAAPPAAAPVAVSEATGLGVQEHDAGGVDVVLLEVKRTSGDTLTLKWQYRNKTREVKELDPYGHGLSEDAYLIDSVNKKKYLRVTDAQGHPLAAEHSYTRLGAGQTLTTWAKFPATPPDVLTISVFLRGVPPFEDVPISK
jgi:hypothetical protein